MLVVVDNCGVPARVTDEVAARLKASAGLSRGSWSARRTPTAVPPWVAPSPFLFDAPIPLDPQERIDRHTPGAARHRP